MKDIFDGVIVGFMLVFGLLVVYTIMCLPILIPCTVLIYLFS